VTTLVSGKTYDHTSAAKIELFVRSGERLVDVDSLEFTLHDTAGVQFYPVSGRQAVDTGGTGRLGTGYYAATWAADGAARGIEVRWYYTIGAAPEVTEVHRDYEVVGAGKMELAAGALCRVIDLRDEGVATATASDTLLARRIRIATRLVERWTRRWFGPRAMRLELDGPEHDTLFVQQPIVGVSAVSVFSRGVSPELTAVSLDDVVVYNRHLGAGVADDLYLPRIAIRGDVSDFDRLFTFWPPGTRNVFVTGAFGYTEWSPLVSAGTIPEDLVRAAVLLVVRDLAVLSDSDRADTRAATRITQIRTRDQSITYSDGSSSGGGGSSLIGALSGDREIDDLVLPFVAAPSIGAV